MKKLLLIVLSVIQISSLFAQLSDEAFDAILKNEDIVILNENMKVSFVGEKAFYINIVVEKEIEYQILTDAGNDYLNPYLLPQAFDEIYKPHSSAIRNELRLFDEIKISDFDVEVILPDGNKEPIDVNRKVNKHRIVTELDRFGDLNSYSYAFRKFVAGEIVKINYKYSFRFEQNWERLLSTRVFQITKIPRKKFDLCWSYNYYLEVDTSFMNGATPQMDTVDNIVNIRWHFENQPGSLDETGSKPYNDLPWFTFTPKPFEFLVGDYNSFKEEFIPFWYFLSYNREDKLRAAIVDFQVGAKDKDNLMFDKIVKKYTNLAPDDSIGITRLRYVQRYIVDSTQYDNDYKLFNREEEYKRDHPGGELLGGIIKEHNKEFVYASLIPKLGNMFFTAYPTDSRTGTISKDYFTPMLDNEFMFATILNNNTLAYIMPKSDKRNLYCEELPFYYENAAVMLLYTYDYAGYKRNFADVLRCVDTPGSSVKDNYRKTSSLVKVNTETGNISFNSKISLSGQYSTLTRSIYNGGHVDSTINPIYLKKVWGFGDTQTITKANVEKTDFYFPFKTSINADYTISGIIEKNEGEIELDLTGWIRHVIYKDFNSGDRFTDFYSDFVGTDTYNYMLEFDKAVLITEIPESIAIDNDFGIYKFDVKQMGETKLLISSYFLVKSHLVSKENIADVVLIFNAIEENNKAVIKLSIQGN